MLDAVAAAAIAIYVAVDVEVAVVVGVATAVIISAMADQDAGNVTTLTEPALVFLLAATQPPVVLPLVAIVALLAPALPITFTGHVKVTVILLIRVATNLKETEKIKMHLSYDLKPRLWASIDGNYWYGGNTTVNDVFKIGTLQSNSCIGGRFRYRLSSTSL